MSHPHVSGLPKTYGLTMKPTTTDDIFDLMESYVTSTALNVALETGLFWLLAEGPMDAKGIAEAQNIPLGRCQYWLQLLVSVGLLQQRPEGYLPSPTTRAAIMGSYSEETWSFLAKETRDRFPALLHLALHIHEPGSVWTALGLTPPDYFAQISRNSTTADRFTRMLYEIHLPLAEHIAQVLDMRGVDRLLDLGGGSGVVSLALLRRYPQLTAVVVDIPNVCKAGRSIAAENSLDDRISYHAADYHSDELPSGFDMVLECDAGPCTESLLGKIRTSLNPGGRLVVVDQFAPLRGVAPSTWLYWAFLASLENPNFTLPTAAEVQKRMEQAGFQVLHQQRLPHHDVLRWSSDWTLIEASK
jgi:tRNA A58 N-methylase Trm61